MDPLCRTFREEALQATQLELGDLGDVGAVAGSAHANSCAACADWLRAVAGQAKALRELTRLEAPFELDGCVVAAVEAGSRQSRAARALESLGRVSSPSELDRAVDAEIEDGALGQRVPSALRAPSVLDRLVSEELADPAKARMRRFLGTLERVHAPEALGQRLASDLARRSERTSARPRAAVWAGLSLAAAAALVWVGIGVRRSPEPVRAYDFVIVDGGSVESLPGVASGLVDGMLGGTLSAGRGL